MRAHRAISIVVLMLCGCKSKPATPPAPPQPAAATPSPTAPEPEAAPASSIAEADLKGLLDRWLAAQNQGQFDAYEGLYATKFYGIKRAGAREFRFDRAGWLKDRRRMFQKPMQVEARLATFSPTSETGDVRFEQHWASGNFSDVGIKRLLVVRENKQLKIAQEELLDSDLVSAGRAQPTAALDFSFALELDSGLYIPLPDAAVPTQLGGYRMESGEAGMDMYTVSRAIQGAELDALLASWGARKLRVDGGCIATVSGFRVMTRVDPHFSDRQRWEGMGTDDDGNPLKPVPTARVAREAYAMGDPLVFARLQGCSDGRYARLESSTPPLAAVEIEDAQLVERALAAFAKLPSVKDEQKRYLAEVEGATGHWRDTHTQVAIYKHPKSGQLLISVLADIGNGCAEFTASEWAVFEVGKSLQRLVPAQTPPSSIVQALDVENDGHLEFIVRRGTTIDYELVWPDSERQGPRLEYVYRDCGC